MTDKIKIAQYQHRFNCILPPEVVFAGEYLEARGYVFGDDFGPSNAISKAAIVLIRERGL